MRGGARIFFVVSFPTHDAMLDRRGQRLRVSASRSTRNLRDKGGCMPSRRATVKFGIGILFKVPFASPCCQGDAIVVSGVVAISQG